MQTFVPYTDVDMCASVLDDKRLNKQILEAFQIYTTICLLEDRDFYIVKDGKLKKRGWVSHPCVLMWKSNKDYLCVYANAVCKEWQKRGHKHVKVEFFQNAISELSKSTHPAPPVWWGRKDVHDSHKSQLLSKNFNHYIQYFKEIPAGLPYIWP